MCYKRHLYHHRCPWDYKEMYFVSANYDSTIVIAEKTRYKLKVLLLCIRIELHWFRHYYDFLSLLFFPNHSTCLCVTFRSKCGGPRLSMRKDWKNKSITSIIYGWITYWSLDSASVRNGIGNDKLSRDQEGGLMRTEQLLPFSLRGKNKRNDPIQQIFRGQTFQISRRAIGPF